MKLRASMRSPVLFFAILAACQVERVQARVVCFDDSECPTGTICGGQGSGCIPIEADDVRNRPSPKNTTELYSRFDRMLPAFESGEQTLHYHGDTEVSEPLEEGVLSLRVSDNGRLHLWGLAISGGGGGALPFWPQALAVRRISIQIPDEHDARLAELIYPQAKAVLRTPVRVVTTVADAAGTTLDTVTELEDATVEVTLRVSRGVVARRILVTIAITALGDDAILHAHALALRATFVGNEVPPEWLPNDDTSYPEETTSPARFDELPR